MLTKLRCPDGTSVELHVPPGQEKRLANTCFRPGTKPRAGNFASWKEARELFRNATVRRDLLATVQSRAPACTSVECRTMIALDDAIGWESTTPIEGIAPEALEVFQPNRKSTGLRVRADCHDILAPTTTLVTVIFSIRPHPREGLEVIVHSLYPGMDIGELDGDLTVRTGRVFFDWRHPGTPI